jgi:hypothetical protein
VAYERTWQFISSAEDYVPANILDASRHRLWAMKSLLKGDIGGHTQGRWTVEGSSDGVTSGMDGTDRWTTTYDGTKIVRGNTAAARSWIVLKSPGTINGYSWYILITYGDSTSDYQFGFHYSQTAYTGGSTTTNPTSTYDLNFKSPTTLASATDNAVYYTQTTARRRMHAIVSTQGDFLIFGTYAGSTHGCEMAMGLIGPVGCNASDLWPMWGAFFNPSGTYDALHSYTLAATMGYGGTRYFDRSVSSAYVQSLCFLPTWSGLDQVSGKLIDSPAWVMVKSSGTVGIARGRLPDIGCYGGGVQTSATGVPNGSTIRDGSNNITYITVGSIIIPFNSVPDFS